MGKLLKNIFYIYWRKDATYHPNVPNEIFLNIYNDAIKNGVRVSSKCIRSEWIENEFSYRFEESGKFMKLFTYHKPNKYDIYTTNAYDNKKNQNFAVNQSFKTKTPGERAIEALLDKFRLINGFGPKSIPLKTAFGYTPEAYKICVPKQLYYINKSLCDRKLQHVSGADFSSHYPSSACGKLPNFHKIKKYQGRVLPNPAYPFAFYLKSGHIAIYNEFDTHDYLEKFGKYPELFLSLWKLDPKDDYKQNLRVTDDEEETVLMAASEFELTDTMLYFYDLRHQDEDAKLVMNAAIGNFHRREYTKYKLAHIAAVIIARSNNKMLKIVEDVIAKSGFNSILHIVVDGIMYLGKYEIGDNVKELNHLNQEFTDCNAILLKANFYAIEKDGKVIKYKHGAANVMDDGSPILEKLDNIEDLYRMRKTLTNATTIAANIRKQESEIN